jgi:hypothetical protein
MENCRGRARPCPDFAGKITVIGWCRFGQPQGLPLRSIANCFNSESFPLKESVVNHFFVEEAKTT